MIIIELIIYSYFLLMVGYVLFLSIAGKWFSNKAITGIAANPAYHHRIAILVPVYKDDGIIYSSACSYLDLNYPRAAYDIYIIADSLKESTLFKLSALPINIIRVQFEKSTKTKSLNKAFETISKEYDIALICDADNILQRDCLLKINQHFCNGATAVQGQRVAKNMDSHFAILDSASELINNHIFRKGTNAAGMSASVIGSGMAFQYSVIKDALSKIQAVGGFDKVLQLMVVEKNIKIQYAEDVLIFDEKISHAEAFGQQRRRWLSSQFLYLKKYFAKGCRQLFKGNLDYFNLAVMHNAILPRVMILAILPLLGLVSLLFHNYLHIPFYYWLILFGAYIFSLMIALPAAFYQPQILRACWSVPRAIIVMIGSLLKLKGANTAFIHTQHHHQQINNPFFNDEVF